MQFQLCRAAVVAVSGADAPPLRVMPMRSLRYQCRAAGEVDATVGGAAEFLLLPLSPPSRFSINARSDVGMRSGIQRTPPASACALVSSVTPSGNGHLSGNVYAGAGVRSARCFCKVFRDCSLPFLASRALCLLDTIL